MTVLVDLVGVGDFEVAGGVSMLRMWSRCSQPCGGRIGHRLSCPLQAGTPNSTPSHARGNVCRRRPGLGSGWGHTSEGLAAAIMIPASG